MEKKDNALPGINVLTFWGTLCQMINKNDLDGFKNLLDTKFSSIDDDKYAKSIFLVDDKYEYLHYLIIERGVKRTDVEEDIINTTSEKLFILQELMAEISKNSAIKNKVKI
jgi:hypothetical protein